MASDFTKQTFLITGAHGFIGAWIVKRLLENGATVVIFDKSADAQRLRLIMSEEEISRARVVSGDITEAGSLSPIIDNFGVTKSFISRDCRCQPVRRTRVWGQW